MSHGQRCGEGGEGLAGTRHVFERPAPKSMLGLDALAAQKRAEAAARAPKKHTLSFNDEDEYEDEGSSDASAGTSGSSGIYIYIYIILLFLYTYIYIYILFCLFFYYLIT